MARLLLGPVCLGMLFWFIPVRDHLTWPSRFPQRLTGTMEREGGQVVFRTTGEVVITLEEDRSQADRIYGRASVRHPGDAGHTWVLADSERQELVGQPVPGLLSVLRSMSPGPFLLALLLYVLSCLLANQRWWMLLRFVEVEASPWRIQRLGFLGLFFSGVLPGLSGGDVARAVYAAVDHPRQRPQAVLAVVIDRFIGVSCLAMIAGVALVLGTRRFDEVGPVLAGILALGAIGLGLFFMPRVSRFRGHSRPAAGAWGARVVTTVRRALTLCGANRTWVVGALILSLGIHGLSLTAVAVVGAALSLDIRSWWDYYGLAPLALVFQSIPLASLGAGEVSFVLVFSRAGLTRPEALALALSYRAVQMLVSLAAGLLLLGTAGRSRPDQGTGIAAAEEVGERP